MSEASKTIAFRVLPAIDEQIQGLAKEAGQSKSDWVRDQIMRALHTAVPSSETSRHAPTESAPSTLLEAVEARVQQMESALGDQIVMVLKAVAESSKAQRKDLRTLGQLGLDSDELLSEQVAAIRDQVLDTIERLKASQRSHKETILQAIGGGHGLGKYGRY